MLGEGALYGAKHEEATVYQTKKTIDRVTSVRVRIAVRQSLQNGLHVIPKAAQHAQRWDR